MKSAILTIGFAWVISLVNSEARSEERPNIIAIMADDLGDNDLAAYGSKDIPTQNQDKLANDGVRFTSGYVTWPMCGPSRAGFPTGKQQSKFGYYENVSAPFDPKQGLPKMETIASLLQKQGYVTGGAGKWHMGTTDEQPPNAMGFDDWSGFLGGGLMYLPLDHPSYNAPHLDLKAPEESIARFPAGKMTKVPGVKPAHRSVYAAMVYGMNQGIGRLLAKFDELGLAENTVVWFLSANGGMHETSDKRPLKDAKDAAPVDQRQEYPTRRLRLAQGQSALPIETGISMNTSIKALGSLSAALMAVASLTSFAAEASACGNN